MRCCRTRPLLRWKSRAVFAYRKKEGQRARVALRKKLNLVVDLAVALTSAAVAATATAAASTSPESASAAAASAAAAKAA